MNSKFEKYQIGHSPEYGKHFIIETNVCHNPLVEVAHSHRHSFFAIFWIHSGNGKHLIDFEEYDMCKDRIFFVRPEQVHFMKFDSSVTFSTIQFSEEYIIPYMPNIEENFSLNNISTYMDITKDENNRLAILFKMLQNEYHSVIPEKELMISHEILLLLIELKRIGGACNNTDNLPNSLVEFSHLLNTRYKDYHTVKEYANELNITSNYLNVLCQKHFNKSALSLINGHIILEIKRLLLRTDWDISTIAYDLHFGELSNFTKFFKRYTSFTPMGFREEMNKIYQNRDDIDNL